MAEITLGLGTSHGSQVSLPPELWLAHGALDAERTDYEVLCKKYGDSLAKELDESVIFEKYERVQSGVNALAEAINEVRPDVVVIVGDDQQELFTDDTMPCLAVFWGESIIEFAPPRESLSPTHSAALWAVHGDVPEAYPVCSELGEWVVRSAVEAGFDLTQLTQQRSGRSLGHAYTFVRRRLLGDALVPIVPVFVNTYYPPNRPSVARCIAFGSALGAAIASWPSNVQVAIVASGGLSHFVVDEELDRLVLGAFQSNDLERLVDVPAETFESGTSEILNWIVASAALRQAGLQMSLLDYVPGLRSLGGTGCGMAFARWNRV